MDDTILCKDGIMDSANTTCCPKTCGVCGGNKCHRLPGGASSCCESHIILSQKNCEQPSDVSCMITPRVLTDCLTNTTNSPIKGKPCIFPWVYDGKDFNACANPNFDLNGSWCPTDLNNVDLLSPKNFGYCNDNCPTEELKIGKLGI